MGKKGKNRREAKGPTGKHHPRSVSLSSFRAARTLDALAPAFVQWFDDGSPGAAAAAVEYLKLMEPVMSHYLESTAAADATSLDPGFLAHAIAEEITAATGAHGPQPTDPEHAAYTVDAVRSYVAFLSETGRWTGSVEQLAGILNFFDSLAEGDVGQPHIQVPEIPQDQALTDIF